MSREMLVDNSHPESKTAEAPDPDPGYIDAVQATRANEFTTTSALDQAAGTTLLAQFSATTFFPPLRDIRHYPEPVDLDYAVYTRILKAEKQVTEKHGSQHIAWRTPTMDIFIELGLLKDYQWWVEETLRDARETCDVKEMELLNALREDLEIDEWGVESDYASISELHWRKRDAHIGLLGEIWFMARDLEGERRKMGSSRLPLLKDGSKVGRKGFMAVMENWYEEIVDKMEWFIEKNPQLRAPEDNEILMQSRRTKTRRFEQD